jgi:hypothetical protein
MQETRNLHQGELENIAVFSVFRDIQFNFINLKPKDYDAAH